MDLKTLFSMQKVLDERIIREKGLEGQDLLQNKILALYVELGELANEWQGFKHWKVNLQPKPKMLEEYVDNLHFILSIGIHFKFDQIDFPYLHEHNVMVYKKDTPLEQFNALFVAIGTFDYDNSLEFYQEMFLLFIGLGELLGFTWSQVEEAYMVKNQTNHERQTNGY